MYLCVKRIKLELVDTLECLGVNLLEGDPVLRALKDVDLLHDIQSALSEVALPGDRHLRLVIPLGGLLVLCVGKHNKRDPELNTVMFFLKTNEKNQIPDQFHFLKGCLKISAPSDCDIKV